MWLTFSGGCVAQEWGVFPITLTYCKHRRAGFVFVLAVKSLWTFLCLALATDGLLVMLTLWLCELFCCLLMWRIFHHLGWNILTITGWTVVEYIHATCDLVKMFFCHMPLWQSLNFLVSIIRYNYSFIQKFCDQNDAFSMGLTCTFCLVLFSMLTHHITITMNLLDGLPSTLV